MLFLLFEIKVKYVIRHYLVKTFSHLNSTYQTNIVQVNGACRPVCEPVE